MHAIFTSGGPPCRLSEPQGPKIVEEMPKGLADPGELSALARRSGNPSCGSEYNLNLMTRWRQRLAPEN